MQAAVHSTWYPASVTDLPLRGEHVEHVHVERWREEDDHDVLEQVQVDRERTAGLAQQQLLTDVDANTHARKGLHVRGFDRYEPPGIRLLGAVASEKSGIEEEEDLGHGQMRGHHHRH